MSHSRIIGADEARALELARKEEAATAALSRQQRRALERMGMKAEARRERVAIAADGVVERSLGQETPGLVAGDEMRAAKIGDVVRLMATALAEYDTTKSAEIMEYVEYRLSVRGRFAMWRSRWAYRAGRVVRAIAGRSPVLQAWLARRAPAPNPEAAS